MSDDYLIGIDVGTTAVKASLFTDGGRIVEHRAISYPTRYPAPTHVEQNPSDWIDAISKALGSFVVAVGSNKVCAIGLTSQVNSHIFCDRDVNVLAPAIVWKDGRAAQQAQTLDALISDEQRMEWWGAPMPIDASHAMARMKWMQDQQPEVWQRTRHVLLPKDYCLWYLTGQLVSDAWSNIGLVNAQLDYIPGLLDLLDGSRSVLPPLQDMASVAGVVRETLPFAGVPVATGTMDAWAGVFGTDVTRAGECVYLSGTSEVLGIVSEETHPTPGVLVMPRNHDITMHIGPTQSGGASQLWFCDLFGVAPQDMALLAGEHRATGKTVPLFLPHLQGERAPIWDSAARGVLVGLDASTDKSAIACAVYEGVAYSARWLLESLQQSAGVQVSRINVGGGGFRSDVWNQIRADVLGVALHRVAVTDPGTLGAAGIGAVAVGIHDSVQEAFGSLVSIDKIYRPDERLSDQTAERMALFRDTYQATFALSHRWLNG